MTPELSEAIREAIAEHQTACRQDHAEGRMPVPMALSQLVGWRKVLAWSLLLATSSILLWWGKITGDGWVQLQMWVTLGLLGGNAVSHLAGAFREKS